MMHATRRAVASTSCKILSRQEINRVCSALFVVPDSRLFWPRESAESVTPVYWGSQTRKVAGATLRQAQDRPGELISGRLDSNQRPPAPKAGALPGCATPRLYAFRF